jgi:hypothetical protein
MADTPEQRLLAMTEAISDALSDLMQVAAQLPIPIVIPMPDRATPHREFMASIERVRTLIEDEPIPGRAIGHLDQAVLSVLIALDLVYLAANEGIGWREDAVYMTCTTASITLRVVLMILDGELDD